MVMSCALILSACGSRPLLSKASFAPNTISPNGDGVADATQIHYELSRKATLSIYLESSDGQRHYFRKEEPRAPGTYDVLFGGAIDGRLLPDGQYKWVVEAAEGNGPGQSLDGRLTIAGG